MAISSSGARANVLPISYGHLVAALLCGLALRFFFITRFPFYAGDTKFYEELARNWLDHGVYGLFIRGELIPVDQRVPGYPAFLAVVYSLFGRTRTAVMLAQAVIDLGSCVMAALIAARIAPAQKKSVVAAIALWLAALCPFTASYTAAVITETLAAFFTTLALLILIWALTDSARDPSEMQSLDPSRERFAGPSHGRSTDGRATLWLTGLFLVAGFIVGLGTLVRPETPLVLAGAGLVICVRWRNPADWSKAVLASLWMGVGLVLALVPWAARNARTMGRIDFLAPQYAESAGDYIPRGFYAWTRTWMVRYRDAYGVTWAVGKRRIAIDAFPGSAFDSDAERTRVASLLASYNSDLKVTPALDRRFEALAHERAARHPLRTFVMIPVERAFVIWFTPRVDVLRYSGRLWPPGEQHQAKPMEFDVTVIFGILNFVYAGLALAGAWRFRANPGCALLVSYLAIRTVLLTQLTTVEPRYVVVCFPIVAALGALAFVKSRRDISSDERKNAVAASAAYVS
ncbi:MAG: hypothetical protein WB987_01085 [Candidatus Acidiferrales bacterium]